MRTLISNALYALAKAIRPGRKFGDRVMVDTAEYRGEGIVCANYPHKGWHDQVCVTRKDNAHNIYVAEENVS
jgi:hypothetical protein